MKRYRRLDARYFVDELSAVLECYYSPTYTPPARECTGIDIENGRLFVKAEDVNACLMGELKPPRYKR